MNILGKHRKIIWKYKESIIAKIVLKKKMLHTTHENCSRNSRSIENYRNILPREKIRVGGERK